MAHVATVWPSWHTAPVRVQTEVAHVHAAVLPELVHVWCGPQVVVATHAVQPLD